MKQVDEECETMKVYSFIAIRSVLELVDYRRGVEDWMCQCSANLPVGSWSRFSINRFDALDMADERCNMRGTTVRCNVFTATKEIYSI